MQLLFVTALALVSIPLFIHKLGSETYGIYALLTITATLPLFTSLGLYRSLVKFVARQGAERESDHDLAASALLLAATLLPVTALLALLHKPILTGLFGLSGSGLPQAAPFFLLLLAANLFLVVSQWSHAILNALQRVYLVNLLTMVYNALYYGGMIAVLLLGYDLTAVGWMILGAGMLAGTISAAVAATNYRQARSQKPEARSRSEEGRSGKYFSNEKRTTNNESRRIGTSASLQHRTSNLELRYILYVSVPKQLRYSLRVYSAETIAWFTEPVAKILLAHFIGLREVGFFDIAIRVKAQLQGVLTRLLDPFFPWIAGMEDNSRAGETVRRAEQLYLLLSLPVIALLLFVLRPLLDLWLGAQNTPEITRASLWITVTFLFTMSALPLYYYLLARDHPAKAVRMNLVIVAVNTGLFFIFLHTAGYYAAVIALCGSALAGFAVALWYQQNLLRISLFSDTAHLIRLALSFAILVAANGSLFLALPGTWLPAALALPVTVILTAALYHWLRLFTWHEATALFRKLKGG